MISNSQKEMINKIKPFIDKNLINKEMNAIELSNLFGLDKDSTNKLLLLYYMNIDIGNKLSLLEFVNGVSYLKNNTSYLDNVDLSAIISLSSIIKNENNINGTKLNKLYLSKYFENVDSNLVNNVYTLTNLPDDYLMTPGEFIEFTLTNMGQFLLDEQVTNLKLLKFIIDDSLNPNKYTASELSNILNQNKTRMYNIYSLILYTNGYEYKLSPVNFVNLILSNKDNELISSKLDVSTLNNLNLLNTIMYGINNNKYYSASEISSLLDSNTDDINLLYSLYEVTYLNKNVTMSLNEFINFVLNKVITNPDYSSNFDFDSTNKLRTIKTIMDSTTYGYTYRSKDLYNILNKLSSDLNKDLVDLVYLYNGSIKYYDESYTLTIEEFVNYLYDDILNDNRFIKFIDDEMNQNIKDSKKMVDDAKKKLVSENYSRMVINTTFSRESDETFEFVQSIKDSLETKDKEIYLIGDSPMAYDISNSFGSELNFITILTMLLIFIVVAFTFKSIITSLVLVLIIQCAVFVTMGILSLTGSSVYFIALLIVQSILMGATIDYAIVFTSYYKELRMKYNIVDALKMSYSRSIHTILTSASILIIVTLVVGNFASAIAAKICITLSEGTICSVILILFILPGILASLDRFICKKGITK